MTTVVSAGLPREPLRSSVVFVLSLSFFGSAIMSSLFGLIFRPATLGGLITIQVSVVLNIAVGTIALLYWVWGKPDYATVDRPLGVTILSVETGLIGLVLVGEGLVLLLLPILGIIGVLVGGIGLGFFFLAKGLWNGKEWSVEIMFILTLIGLIVAIILLLLQLGAGTPILAVFQLWYLRRPHLRRFFYDSPNSRAISRGYGPFRDPIPQDRKNQSSSSAYPVEESGSFFVRMSP